MPPRHRTALPLVTASAALALAAGTACAQERSPYYIGVSQTFTHDNNVYRSDTNQVSETISSTGVVAGFDQPLGRQRFYGDASAQVNMYRKVDALDNKSYAVSAGLDWETIEFLTGQLRYSTRNSLADFGTLNGSTASSDQVTQQALATVRYGVTSKLMLDAGYEYRSLEYRNDLYASRDYSQNAVNAGLRWGTTGLLTFGVAYRLTNGSTPQFQSTPPYEDELERRDVDFTVAWTPTGFSNLSARVSSTRETHTLNPSAKLNAVTGALIWNYRPTAKLNFTTSLVRDTGTETTFLATAGAGTTPLPVDSSRLSTLGQIEATYAMTSKLSLGGEARHRKSTLGSGSGDDKSSGYGIRLTYSPTRSTSLSCSVMQETRDAQGSTAYSATTSGCSAQITLR